MLISLVYCKQMIKLCLLSSPVLVLFSKVLYVREKVKFIWLLGDYRTRNVYSPIPGYVVSNDENKINSPNVNFS